MGCPLLATYLVDPIFVLTRMKRMDVRQAQREKLALNLLIWFICGCAVFVITVLGVLICPTEHVFNTPKVASATSHESKQRVYFDTG